MATTRENIGYIVAVTKMVSKLSKIREKSDNRALTDLLEKSEFFQRLANDLTERQELIQSASEHMKYKFYPKGSIIHGYDESVCSVRAIVKGKAFVYTPRKQEAMKKEYYDLKKSQVIREYIQCIEDQELQEKFTQWLNKKEAGTRALRKRMNLLTARSDRNSTANIELVDFSSVVNKILEDKSSLLPSHLRDYDITAKEKLLLLAHFGMMGKYMQDGVFTLEVTREMQPGDSYGEISLLKASTFEGVIVAAEDVHLISFARDDYRSLFTKDIKNLQNKIEFLTKMFSDISKASIIKIAYYLEEKVLMSRETLYKEGEEAKAIYFVRKGEMQLSVQKVKSSKNLLKVDSKSKSLERFNTKHQRIIVGSLQPGTMFGEEDVIERIPRKYTAMATQPHTFVYVLRREVFTEIFEKHTPHIAAVFQDWMKVKSIWRNQRIGTEQELMSQQEPEVANPYAMEIKSPTAQEPQQKFYTPKRETFIAHTEHGDVPEFQERVTFRVLPSSKATQGLNPATPRGNSSQSNSEYQLFDRIQLDKISLSSRKPIKRILIKPGKETPRKEPQSARQSGSISTIPSLGDLTLPKPSESRPVKVRTLNNELVSAETRFPRKIKTLLSVDRDNVDTAALPRPFTGSLKSARVKSYNNLPDGSSPYMMTTTTLTTLNGMNTTNVSQKKSNPENSKLSRESVKILHRLILKQPDLSEANHTESQVATEDQFVNFHRREQRLQGDSNRTSVKRTESRENSLSRLPKSEYSLNIIHDEKLRLRTTMGSIRNMIGAKRTNTMSVKNLEFGL